MRIFSKEEMKIIYYILGKDINDKWLSEEELEFVKDMDFTDKSLPDVAKQVWDNRNNPKSLKIFAKIAKQENVDKIAKTIDKLIERKEDKYMNNKLELVKSEKFGEVECNFYKNDNGDIFVTRNQIGKALEYSNPNIAITKIHKRYKSRLDKFSVYTNMVGTDGKMYNTCVYNAKGIYEICRHSEQPKADAFYDWVYDVLESLRNNGTYSLDTNGLMRQLVDSQTSLNYVLAGFKMQIDNDFKETNNKLSEHDELLKKRVYINPVEAKRIQEAVKEKAKQIAIDNNLQYHTVKSKLFARLYDKLKNKFNVATYRELPSIYFDDIMKSINKLSIYIRDLKEEQCQMSM